MDTQSQLYTSLTRYLNSLTGRNLSEHTASAYRTDLLQFLSFLTENDISVTSPSMLTRTHILDYLSHLANLGRSGVTRSRKLAAIREYCKFLITEKILRASPTEAIVRPKGERKQRVFLRVDEYMRLLNAAAGNSRDYAILQLFLQTGIRVAELVGLTLSDIDLEKKATQALRAYLATRQQSTDQHIFLNYQGTQLSVRGVMDIVEKYRRL